MFLMSSQVKKSSQRELRDKKHQHFSTVSLPTDSVIVDHAVFKAIVTLLFSRTTTTTRENLNLPTSPGEI
jgi:hypothetical protein